MEKSVVKLMLILILTLSFTGAIYSDTWECQYSGTWNTLQGDASGTFEWAALWTSAGSSWEITGQYSDTEGTASLNGNCNGNNCYFRQNYASGSLQGNLYSWYGNYTDEAMDDNSSRNTFQGTWGYGENNSDGGNWYAQAICQRQETVDITQGTSSVYELNAEVINYVQSNQGRQIGRGECWDIAKEVLDRYNAEWDGMYVFGRRLEPGEQVRAGDFIQFEQVRIEWNNGNSWGWQEYGAPHHTAVIYEVLGGNRYRFAHQNVGGVRTLFIDQQAVDMGGLVRGYYIIYRPYRNN